MLPSALRASLQNFKLIRLEFTIQLNSECTLPSFGGSMVHGFLGYALRSVNPEAFHICYGRNKNDQPRPYSVIPELDSKTQWNKGELYRFEIKLFGEATLLKPLFIKAVHIWEKRGLGEQRVAFRTVNVCQIVGNQRFPVSESFTLFDHLNTSLINEQKTCSIQKIGMTWYTPVRLKKHGNIIREFPRAAHFTPHIIRRFCQLTEHWVDTDLRILELAKAMKPQDIPIDEQHYCFVEDWQRFSIKQDEFLPFSGIKGQVNWQGELTQHLPWLAIGEQLQIGGKTTFGLGCYHLSVN